MAGTLTLVDDLASARRLRIAAGVHPAAWEIAALLTIGLSTGVATSYVKLDLQIPGHAILLAVVPIALGIALVPRRFAGTIMSASSVVVMAAAMRTGFGALASMFATGVFLDLALRKARPGLSLYAAFLLAGLGGNAVAWIARAGGKLSMLDPGILPFAGWWSHALLSYAVCGALAGVASAAICFRLRR
jgi:hypothetical protein